MKRNQDPRIKERKELISKYIKTQREKKGLTQIQLSQKANVSLATVRNIEQGSSGYSAKILKTIAVALEISPPDLVDMAIREQKDIEGVVKAAVWTGRESKPTKEQEAFSKDLRIFFDGLIKKVPTAFHEILFDMDYFLGLQEFLHLAIEYDVTLPNGILPKGNRKK